MVKVCAMLLAALGIIAFLLIACFRLHQAKVATEHYACTESLNRLLRIRLNEEKGIDGAKE